MKTVFKKPIAFIMALILSLSVIAYSGDSVPKVSAAAKTTVSINKSPKLNATKIKADSVKLKWSKAKGATLYKVYRSTNKKKWKLIKTTKATSLTVKKLKADKKYYFRVRAFRKKVKSPYSKIVTVKTKKAAVENTENKAPVTTTASSARPAVTTTVPSTTAPATTKKSLNWENGTALAISGEQRLPVKISNNTVINSIVVTKERYTDGRRNSYGRTVPQKYRYKIVVEGNTNNILIPYFDRFELEFYSSVDSSLSLLRYYPLENRNDANIDAVLSVGDRGPGTFKYECYQYHIFDDADSFFIRTTPNEMTTTVPAMAEPTVGDWDNATTSPTTRVPSNEDVT